jgi:hypothetical protein
LGETPDGEGGFYSDYIDIAGAINVPVEVIPLKAERRAELRSWNIVATHQIRARHHIPLVEVGRMVWGDRHFYIKTVENMQERDIEQYLLAEERRQ